jgi:hypothetical protein
MPALALVAPLLATGASAAAGAGTLATVAGLAGAGVSALGAIGQGEANSKMAAYQAQVSANNAITAEQNANYATAAGEQRATLQGLKERQQSQAVTAGLSASGIDVNTGSPAQVRESQAELGQEDVETVRQQAALTAYGYRTQATGFTAQQQLQQSEASYAPIAGFTTAAGDLLTGAAKFGPGSPGATGGTDTGDQDFSGGVTGSDFIAAANTA